MASETDRSRLATRWDRWWSLRVALLLTLVIASFAGLRTVVEGGGAPRWTAVASCVASDVAAVRRISTTVDASWCSSPPVRSVDARPSGSVVVAFVLPASAGAAPQVRDLGVDKVGRALFLAYDAGGDAVPEAQRVVVFVAVMRDELPGSSFEISDDTGRVQVRAAA